MCVKGEEWILIFSVCADCRRMAMLWKTHLGVLGTAPRQVRPYCSRMSVAAALLTGLALGAVELTAENWDAQLAGRAAFVKFLAPW